MDLQKNGWKRLGHAEDELWMDKRSRGDNTKDDRLRLVDIIVPILTDCHDGS